MLQFLKYVLATLVGLFLFGLFSVFILAGIVAAGADDKVTVEPQSVLRLTLNQQIVERAPNNPLERLDLPTQAFRAELGLDQILASIRKAKTDKNIKGIYLQPTLVTAGMATLEEIREALLDFKKSGKFVVAYSELYNEKAYYLSSVAERIYLNPVGALEFNGLSSEVMFFKGTLEKLGIEPVIFKVGDYKSAVEPFLLKEMSAASREQTSSFLNSINDYQLRKVAEARQKTYEHLKLVSDSMLVRTPEDAAKYGLVTHVGYQEEVLEFMRSRTKIDKDEDVKFVDLNTYRKTVTAHKTGSGKHDIAVIYATGDINSGEGDDNSIGSDRLAEAIRKARLDDKVKAIVLRINSPGGSALASDVIWHEVQLTNGVKPIIASMSDVAASGGYYIAMACDTIMAHPTTITGSIGVFGLLANLEPFLQDKLGVTVDRVRTGKFSDVPSFTRPMTDFEKKTIMHEVERIYDDFTKKAAKARRMPQEQLKQYASGRVWSGTEARERHLVDLHGGLKDAIALAARKAGVAENYRVKYLPEQKSWLDDILGDMRAEAMARSLRAELGPLYPAYQTAKKVQQLMGVQARLPFELVIE